MFKEFLSSYTRNKDYFYLSHIITSSSFYLNPNDITKGAIFLLVALQEKRTDIKTSDILLQVSATRALLYSFVHIPLVLVFCTVVTSPR